MNENNEANGVIVKQKSNKGVKIFIAILILIILILLAIPEKYELKDGGTIVYKAKIWECEKVHSLIENGYAEGTTFKLLGIKIYDDVKEISSKTKNNEETKTDTKTEDNTTKDEVPITDKSAFIVKGSSIGGSFIYCYIQDGSLYYYGVNAPKDKTDTLFGASYSDDGHKQIHSSKKYEGLNNIKRIKVFNEGTGVAPHLYLITEDGKVYTDTSLSTYEDIGFEQLNDLKDYQVDDLLDYKQPADPETYYKVKLKDGTIKDLKIQH